MTSDIESRAARHSMTPALYTKYTNQIKGRQSNDRYSFDDCYDADSKLGDSLKVAKRYDIEPERRREVLRMAHYEEANQSDKYDKPVEKKISSASNRKKSHAEGIVSNRGYFGDNHAFINEAQSLGLGFPSEGSWNRGRIDWNHKQQETLRRDDGVRIAITSFVEEMMTSRVAKILADLDWLEQGGKSLGKEEAKQLWESIYASKKEGLDDKYSAAVAGETIPQEIPTWDDVANRYRYETGLVPNDSLAQLIAALPEGSNASTRINTLLETTLGPESLSGILESAESYRSYFAESAEEAQEERSRLREEGKARFSQLKDENFSTEQVVDSAVNFWLGNSSPHVAMAPGESIQTLGFKRMAQESNKPGDSSVANFKDELSTHIEDSLLRGEKVELVTDYDPKGLLAEIAAKHDINGVSFPEKTRMTIYPDRGNRLAVEVVQFDPYRKTLPLSNESFRDSDADRQKLKQYEDILL